MAKFHLKSFLYGAVLLLLVLMSKSEGNEIAPQPATNRIRATSLSAAIADQISAEKVPPESYAAPKLVTLELKSPPLSTLTPERRTREDLPEIKANAFLASDLNGAFSIAEKNAGKRWPMASLTKLMTAAVTFLEFNPEVLVTLSETAVASDGQAGGFSAGEIFSVSDLSKAMLMTSSNDAAYALAEFFGYEDFIKLMQIKAFDLGMQETTFADPIGLSVLNQSTLKDLEKFVRYAVAREPRIFEITRAPSANIIEARTGNMRSLKSNNIFAGRADFLGGKTGYTDDASGNLISLFKHQNHLFLIIVFGTNDRFGETEKLYQWLISNI